MIFKQSKYLLMVQFTLEEVLDNVLFHKIDIFLVCLLYWTINIYILWLYQLIELIYSPEPIDLNDMWCRKLIIEDWTAIELIKNNYFRI